MARRGSSGHGRLRLISALQLVLVYTCRWRFEGTTTSHGARSALAVTSLTWATRQLCRVSVECTCACVVSWTSKLDRVMSHTASFSRAGCAVYRWSGAALPVDFGPCFGLRQRPFSRSRGAFQCPFPVVSVLYVLVGRVCISISYICVDCCMAPFTVATLIVVTWYVRVFASF